MAARATLIHHLDRRSSFDLGQEIKDLPSISWSILEDLIYILSFIATLLLVVLTIVGVTVAVFKLTTLLFRWLRDKHAEWRNRREAQAQELTRFQEWPPQTAASVGESVGLLRGSADGDEDEEAKIGQCNSAETDGSRTLVF